MNAPSQRSPVSAAVEGAACQPFQPISYLLVLSKLFWTPQQLCRNKTFIMDLIDSSQTGVWGMETNYVVVAERCNVIKLYLNSPLRWGLRGRLISLEIHFTPPVCAAWFFQTCASFGLKAGHRRGGVDPQWPVYDWNWAAGGGVSHRQGEWYLQVIYLATGCFKMLVHRFIH